LSQNRNKGLALLNDDAFPGSIKGAELLDQSSDCKLVKMVSIIWSKFIPCIQWLPLALFDIDLTKI
jgi:hypothetical protein